VSRLPIRLRVTAAFALAMAVVLVGSGLFLYFRLQTHLTQSLDLQLELRAQDLTTLVQDPHASLARDSGGRFIERGESFAQLLDRRGRVLDASRPLGDAPLLTPQEVRRARGGPVTLERSAVRGLNEPARLLASPVGRGVLVVGATEQNNADTLASLRNELLVAGPVALVLASLVGYILAGSSLRPVERMRRRAAEIGAETPGERLPVPRTRDEIERLGTTLNEMLARLEQALEHERAFVADASHELRTPLALLRTELELALRHGGTADELRAAIGRSAEETDRLTQLAESLLLMARADRGDLPLDLESLDVAELLGSVANRFAWRTEEAGRPPWVVAPAGVRVSGDRLRLEQALSNLVDNALRHGDGRVTLSAVTADGHVELHVSDEGAGFPHDFRSRAFERFSRADAARGRGGAGLGLSIVEAITRAHGGSAHVATGRLRGADVWLELPRVDAPT
jgi:two-component system OmpR family sensor kinase